MANVLSKGSLFPAELVSEMFNTVRGKSSLARLSGSMPVPFNGNDVFTFSFDNEVDLVGENGAKSNGGGAIAPVQIRPVKVEYGMRVSDEFMYASEETRLNILATFAEGFARKAARGLDIMAFHGINPRTGSAATQLATKNFDALVSQTVTVSANPNVDVAAAISTVEAAEHEVTGMAMAPAFRTSLASLTKGTNSNEPMFPELAWGSNPGVINGLPVDVNSTVSYGTGVKDRAIVGNFADFFKWGYAKEIPVEVIEYGNPDNDAQAGDLKGHNQVYLRGEAYVGWGILVPSAFARIVTA